MFYNGSALVLFHESQLPVAHKTQQITTVNRHTH